MGNNVSRETQISVAVTTEGRKQFREQPNLSKFTDDTIIWLCQAIMDKDKTPEYPYQGEDAADNNGNLPPRQHDRWLTPAEIAQTFLWYFDREQIRAVLEEKENHEDP